MQFETNLHSVALSLGTVLFTFFYFIAGINKMLNFRKSYKNFGFKFPSLKFISPLILFCVVLVEIFSPLGMLYGTLENSKQQVTIGNISAWSLIGFTVLATLLYHFPPTNPEHRMPFLRNIAFIGGFLIYIYKH